MSIFRNERLENLLNVLRWSPAVRNAGTALMVTSSGRRKRQQMTKTGTGRRGWRATGQQRKEQGSDAPGPVYRPWQRGCRAAGRTDRGRRRRPDDADADPALRGKAVFGDLQRPGGRGADAAGRRGRAPVQEDGEPAPGRLDGVRFGADGVRWRLLPARTRGLFRGAGQRGEVP